MHPLDAIFGLRACAAALRSAAPTSLTLWIAKKSKHHRTTAPQQRVREKIDPFLDISPKSGEALTIISTKNEYDHFFSPPMVLRTKSRPASVVGAMLSEVSSTAFGALYSTNQNNYLHSDNIRKTKTSKWGFCTF